MAHNTNRGRRLSNFGIPRPHTRGPRPQVWKSGTDPVRHEQFRVWGQQKNQAQWREEGWQIPFEAWCALWDASGQWLNRGRERGCYCMSRLDWSLPWTVNNVAIITREAHAKMQGDARAAGWCSIAQRRRRGRKRQGELDFASHD
jgi:hypothetical protein